MSETEVATADAPASNPTVELNLHWDFAQKAPGDVILHSDDVHKMSFYFSPSLLSALSSFFRNLPPPSPTDMIDGAALIPIPDISSHALLIALSAVRATTRAEEFSIPSMPRKRGSYPIFRTGHLIPPIIDAALFASRFDLPAIYRILVEGVQKNLDVRREPFLPFSIWAISGVRSKIAQAGEATIGSDITHIAKPIATALRQHAPECWMKLQDLHLRRALGHKRFHGRLVDKVHYNVQTA